MKTIVFALALFGILGCASATYSICLAQANFSTYNLCPFSKEGQIEFSRIVHPGLNITFGLGSDHIKGCDGTTDVWAKVHSQDEKYCSVIAKKDPVFSLLNMSNSTQGVRIDFPGEKIEESIYEHFVVELHCDMSEIKIKETPFTVKTSLVGTNLTYIVKGRSRFACPALSFEQLINFVANNQYVFAAIFSIIGLILTFFGLKFINFTVFTVTATAGTAVSGMFLYQFTDVTASQWIFWVLFFVCLVLGLAMGYAALKLEKVAIFLVGGVLGFIGGDLLYMTVIHPMLTQPVNPNIFRIVVIVCVLIAGFLAFFLFETVFIVATSLIGSYMIIRCVSIFVGHFPAEINVSQGAAQFDAYAYGYFAAIVTLALLGMKVQHSTKSKDKKNEADLEQNLPKYGYAYYKY